MDRRGRESGIELPLSDRVEAGRLLAGALSHLANREDVLVLALPRGGVPVGAEVARALNAPFDVLIVRKLGVPGREELAMGAVASGGVRVLNRDVVRHLGITPDAIEATTARERREVERREDLYRKGREHLALAGRCIVLVDDGLATGSTMLAAIEAVRQAEPGRIVVAVPVAPEDTIQHVRRLADEVICLATPEPFYAIGQWYVNFDQVNDDEVRRCLASFPTKEPSPRSRGRGTA